MNKSPGQRRSPLGLFLGIHLDVKHWTYISYLDSRLLERDLKKRFEFELARE